MKSDNLIEDKSFDFAVRIVNLYKHLQNEHRENVMSKQVLRCGTSIGANIHEANYAHSRADFISKMQIALKECYETEYWLKLFVKTNIIDENVYKKMQCDCGKIRRLLIASINTAKSNS